MAINQADLMVYAQEMANQSFSFTQQGHHIPGSPTTGSGVLHPSSHSLPEGWDTILEFGTRIINTGTPMKLHRLFLTYEEPGVVMVFQFQAINDVCQFIGHDDTPRERPTVWDFRFNTPKGQHYVSLAYSGGRESHNLFHMQIKDVAATE